VREKLIVFNYSNNYLEEIIAKILGFNTIRIGYSEDNTTYYYWYDKRQEKLLIDNIPNIENGLNKIEECKVMVDLDFQCNENEVALILQHNQIKEHKTHPLQNILAFKKEWFKS